MELQIQKSLMFLILVLLLRCFNSNPINLSDQQNLKGESLTYLFNALNQNLTQMFLYLEGQAINGSALAQQQISLFYTYNLVPQYTDNEYRMAKALLFSYFASVQNISYANNIAYKHLVGIGAPKKCRIASKYYYEISKNIINNLQEDSFLVSSKKRVSTEMESSFASVEYLQYQSQSGSGQQSNLNLGKYYLYGHEHVQQNFTLAFQNLQKAAQKGNKEAVQHLAIMYSRGLGTQKNLTEAEKLFLTLKNQVAQNGLGYIYYELGSEQKAKDQWTKAALSGYSDAQYNLGSLIMQSKKPDYRQVVEYWKLASTQGHIRAMYSLGTLHLFGIGIHKSCDISTQLFKEVSERALGQKQERA